MTVKMIKRPPSGVELKLEGRLDTTSAPAAQEALLKVAGEYAQLELNLEGLAYISSAGLRVLLILQKQVNRTGGSMKLTHVRAEIMEVLEMTGFNGILRIE